MRAGEYVRSCSSKVYLRQFGVGDGIGRGTPGGYGPGLLHWVEGCIWPSCQDHHLAVQEKLLELERCLSRVNGTLVRLPSLYRVCAGYDDCLIAVSCEGYGSSWLARTGGTNGFSVDARSDVANVARAHDACSFLDGAERFEKGARIGIGAGRRYKVNRSVSHWCGANSRDDDREKNQIGKNPQESTPLCYCRFGCQAGHFTPHGVVRPRLSQGRRVVCFRRFSGRPRASPRLLLPPLAAETWCFANIRKNSLWINSQYVWSTPAGLEARLFKNAGLTCPHPVSGEGNRMLHSLRGWRKTGDEGVSGDGLGMESCVKGLGWGY